MTFEKLMEKAKKTKSLPELAELMEENGFSFDDLNEDYGNAVEIMSSYHGDEDWEDYCVMIHVYQTDDLVRNDDDDADEEVNEAYEEFLDKCYSANWEAIAEDIECFYLYVMGRDGKEIVGYKDFGISEKKWDELSSR